MRLSFDIKLYLVTNTVKRRHRAVSFCKQNDTEARIAFLTRYLNPQIGTFGLLSQNISIVNQTKTSGYVKPTFPKLELSSLLLLIPHNYFGYTEFEMNKL